MSQELLFEIGTEEIPAGYLEGGLLNLKRMAEEALKNNRIDMEGELHTFGTPRRLTLVAGRISEKQQDLVQEMTGPPKNVGYDKEGQPTKAAFGFAKKQGITVDEIGFIDTPKGEYLYVKKHIQGRPTKDVLADVLPKLIAAMPWPKSMRWGSVGFSFVRPIHWVVALLGGETVSFEVGGVRSGDTTRGHRFMSSKPIQVSGVEDYLKKIKDAFVIVDQGEREQCVKKAVFAELEKAGGVPAEDPELVKTVANLTEYPSAVCGRFDEAFLALPDTVLITAMREHQKYFAVYDRDKKLMPNFVAVNNTAVRDESVVKRGHERVLRARLSDAEFFFKEDRKRPLKDRLEDLKGVIYQADLGTSYEKVERFTRIAEYLCKLVFPEALETARTVSSLCKCDLVTLMVTEFPGLQGIMGMEYTKAEGYPWEVSSAIYEHYLPTRSGGNIPESEIGAIVGCADRVDTVAGCFAVGLEPTGSADPFALRRHSLAILRIMEKRGWDVSLRELIGKALSILAEKVHFDKDRVPDKVMEFFRERYKHRMLAKGYESDLIEAVISVSFDKMPRLNRAVDQIKKFSMESKEFPALIQAFKRVSNILKKQDEFYEVNENLLKENCESALWKRYNESREEVFRYIEDGDYFKTLERLTGLIKPVDDFFEGVEILTGKNEALRKNRIGILRNIESLFLSLADLSKFSA